MMSVSNVGEALERADALFQLVGSSGVALDERGDDSARRLVAGGDVGGDRGFFAKIWRPYSATAWIQSASTLPA